MARRRLTKKEKEEIEKYDKKRRKRNAKYEQFKQVVQLLEVVKDKGNIYGTYDFLENYCRSLSAHEILDRCEDRGLVKPQKKGRKVYWKLTKKGNIILKQYYQLLNLVVAKNEKQKSKR